MNPSFEQLTIALPAEEAMTFDSFYCNEENQTMVRYLQGFLSQDIDLNIYIWGLPGLGKTHLLQSLCNAGAAQGKSAVCLSLAEDYAQPDMLQGLEDLELVCLDDVHIVAKDEAWEHALFHCYNRIRERGHHLALSACQSPSGLGIALPDLASRMQWSTVFKIQPLSDEDKVAWINDWSKQRGMPMPIEVVNYLLTRMGRSVAELMEVLTVLETETLKKKRRLTLPFARACLAEF